MNSRTRKMRIGVALLVVGLLLVLTGVFTILNASTGEGEWPRTFAHRRSYNQVKVAMHEVFPEAGSFAAAGVLLAILGGRLVGRNRLTEPENSGGVFATDAAPESESSQGPQ